MDKTEIESLIQAADRRALLENQVEHAKERFTALNILAWDGHVFELTPGFVTYVLLQFMYNQKDGTPVVLLDRKNEPVLVEDMEEFVDQMQERHTEALNDYHDKYQSLRLARSNQELIEVA